MMNIQLFNFLEDFHEEIEDQLKVMISNKFSYMANLTREDFQSLAENWVDAYIDLLVTNQLDSVDKAIHEFNQLITGDRRQAVDLVEMNLMLSPIIKQLLLDKEIKDESKLSEFSEARGLIEATTYQMAGRVLELHQKKRQDALGIG